MPSPRGPAIWTAPPAGPVLILAPHADDEALGCGGVIALHADQGDPVHVIIATDGAAGDPVGHYRDHDYPALRRAEARRAAEILGVASLQFWSYPDARLAEAMDLSERVVEALMALQPTLVYYPSTAEVHSDHSALGRAVVRALRAVPAAPRAAAYEVWAALQPSHIIDITPVWDRKRKAIEQYETQLRYNDYLHMIAGLNAYRTIHLPSARFVEAFEVR
jgi:LmbE family N-acetylglucosaminyl deacetylase